MTLKRAKPQKFKQLKLPFDHKGEAPRAKGSEEARMAGCGTEHPGTSGLMVRVLEPMNCQRALKRVRKNKGSPGADGMTVDELPGYLREHWPRIRKELSTGSYQPTPVKRREIPKRGGGVRQLGIPTVLDRFIQQVILQVLQPLFDPTFSEHSYGFRPGRSAHQAIKMARHYVQAGRRIVVDADLANFFDRVNHDVLMGKLAKRIEDKTLLRLIRRYLQAGVMVNGVVVERHEGSPQGGPLSPLLANALLDEVDKELERRGHTFARYADDLNVYVKSRRAGVRVMASLEKLFTKLRLSINKEKSAVDSVFKRTFLGFSFWRAPGMEVRFRASGEAVKTLKDRIRRLTRRNRGVSLQQVANDLKSYLTGWKNYFRLASTPRRFRVLDQWIRHRLRAFQLKQWKRGRTAFRELVARGMSKTGAREVAANWRRWWHNSRMLINVAFPIRFFDGLGVPRLDT